MALSSAEDRSPLTFGCTEMPIHYRLYGVSTGVNVPNLPLSYLLGHRGTQTLYTEYLKEHLEWKKKVFTLQDEAELRRSSIRELESLNLGFPGIDSKNHVLAMSAYLVYIFYIDDLIEDLDIETAKRCVQSCVTILGGGPPPETSDDTPESFRHCTEYTLLLREHLASLLIPSTAVAVFQDIQDMVVGQIPELIHNRENSPLQDFAHYIRLRYHPHGLLPIMTIAEHYYYSGRDGSQEPSPYMKILKERMVALGIVQNDIGGVEKDLAKGNRSNTLTALGELEGCPVTTAHEFFANQVVLQRAVEEHNRLMDELLQAWSDIRTVQCSEGTRRAADMVLTLSVTHLQWTLSTQRYAVEGLKDVTKQY